MADYLATNTPRLKVLQSGPRGTHHMLFRAIPASDVAAVVTEVRSIVTLMNGLCLDGTSWASAEWAAEGSEVFLPVSWGAAITAASGAAASAVDEYGRYVRFEGKSTTGARVSWALFNVLNTTGTANNRLTGAENAAVNNIVAGLNGSTSILCAIDQNPFFMKTYGNTGINDAVAKRSRIFA